MSRCAGADSAPCSGAEAIPMRPLLRRLLIHGAALLLAGGLGLGGGMWLLVRRAEAARTAPPRPGEVLSGQVMNVQRDGRLELLQWNGRRARVRLRGLELRGTAGLVALIDRASGQNVDVTVAALDADGTVCGDIRFLGLDLALDLLHKGAAREALDPRDPLAEDLLARALAEQEGLRRLEAPQDPPWRRGLPPPTLPR